MPQIFIGWRRKILMMRRADLFVLDLSRRSKGTALAKGANYGTVKANMCKLDCPYVAP
jgi:hypothetical protein